jgi:bifunctional UDP-N-acetylglucosamine pyrophosphorylase/glucosamine-1-phosphate N-acetyltransferase
MISSPLSIIILAAGKGTRMKSSRAKVLHEVFYAPMVHHVINAALPLQPTRIVVIVGHQKSAVENALGGFDIEFAVQEKQLGTGHAVLAAERAIDDSSGTVMILCGDTPLIRSSTLQDMYSRHLKKKTTLTLMTTKLQDPSNYGRILCNTSGKVEGIVEQKDATPQQLQIQEINAGIYCVDKTFLFSALKNVGTDNSQGEVYLTDIVKLAVEGGMTIEKYTTDTPMDVLGVNSRVELADAQKELQLRRNRELMLQGVSMHNPETISISPDSFIGKDSSLDPGVHISDNSNIGHSCKIEQGVILKNCRIGDNVTIGPYSCLVDSTIAPCTTLAPFSKSY